MSAQVVKSIVYDAKLRRPGCALLQAALGGDRHVASLFPSKSWLLAPTPNMKVYAVLAGELRQLVEMAEKEFGKV